MYKAPTWVTVYVMLCLCGGAPPHAVLAHFGALWAATRRERDSYNNGQACTSPAPARPLDDAQGLGWCGCCRGVGRGRDPAACATGRRGCGCSWCRVVDP